MISVTERFYELKELSDEAKERARNWIRNNEAEDSAWISENLTEDFECTLKEEGFMEPELQWSLSHCQGDGVAFSARLDLQVYMTKHNLTGWGPMHEFVAIYVHDRGTHYHHENTMTVELVNECDYDDDEAEWWCHKHEQALLEHVKARVRDLSFELRERGYAELEFRNSDEYIDEEAERQELLFDEDGEWVSWKRLARYEKERNSEAC